MYLNLEGSEYLEERERGEHLEREVDYVRIWLDFCVVYKVRKERDYDYTSE